jgi:hypothetical protein
MAVKFSDKLTIGLMFVSILIAFGSLTAKYFLSPPLGVPDYEISLLLALAAAILSTTVRCWVKALDADKQLEVLRAKIDRETMLSSVMSQLIQSHPIVQNVGISTLLSQTSSIQNKGRGFSIKGTNWAMRSNTNFWKALCHFIERPEPGERRPALKCLVVHSGDPHIWKERDALASLEQQKSFIEAGGEIKRIIVGDFPIKEIKQGIEESKRLRPKIGDIIAVGLDSNSHSPSKSGQTPPQNRKVSKEYYGDLMRLMADYKVKIYYAPGFEDDYSSDFALVKHKDRSVVMEWVNTHRFGEVKECIYHDLEENDVEFENRWKSLRHRAKNMTELARSVRSAISHLSDTGISEYRDTKSEVHVSAPPEGIVEPI